MADVSLEELFEVQEREFIDDLFEEAFEDLHQCQRSLDMMRAGKAATPASRNDIYSSRGLVPQGEGGNVVRIPRRQVCQTCPHFLYH